MNLTPADMCLPPYDPYRSPVPCMDMECPPVRMMRDPFVMKSNYISYATHASWQQEVWAAVERSRKHAIRWLDGLIEVDRPEAEILIVSSGTAVSQGREAQALLEEDGINVGIVKIKTLRPWPEEEIREATKHATHIIVPEFNVTGWLAQEIRATIPNSDRVFAGPHVCGGMTMPPEIIAADIKKRLGIKSESLARTRELTAFTAPLTEFLCICVRRRS